MASTASFAVPYKIVNGKECKVPLDGKEMKTRTCTLWDIRDLDVLANILSVPGVKDGDILWYGDAGDDDDDEESVDEDGDLDLSDLAPEKRLALFWKQHAYTLVPPEIAGQISLPAVFCPISMGFPTSYWSGIGTSHDLDNDIAIPVSSALLKELKWIKRARPNGNDIWSCEVKGVTFIIEQEDDDLESGHRGEGGEGEDDSPASSDSEEEEDGRCSREDEAGNRDVKFDTRDEKKSLSSSLTKEEEEKKKETYAMSIFQNDMKENSHLFFQNDNKTLRYIHTEQYVDAKRMFALFGIKSKCGVHRLF